MTKFGLIVATAALVGLAAPAFAINAGTSVKARTPVVQADVNAGATSSVRVHRNRGVNKMVQHDRGLHRGFTHSRHLGYAKNRSSRTSVTVGSGVSAR